MSDSSSTKPRAVKVEVNGASSEEHLHTEIVNFERNNRITLPNISLEDPRDEGWWRNRKKQIERQIVKRTIEEQTEILQSFNKLHEGYLTWLDHQIALENKLTELGRAKLDGQLTNLEFEVKKQELYTRLAKHRRDQAEHEAAIKNLNNPPPPAPLSPVEEKKIQLEVAQLEAQIQKLKSPPKALTPEEHTEEELKAFKHLEAWRGSWPADESEAMKQVRLRIYKEKKGRIMNEA